MTRLTTPALAWLASCLLAPVASAQLIGVSSVALRPDNRLELVCAADTNHYYILLKGDLESIAFPAAVALGMSNSCTLTDRQNVSFFAAGQRIGTATGPNYTLDLANIPDGAYTVSAEGTLQSGATFSSDLQTTVIGAAADAYLTAESQR
jgi:hypothetical protein